MTTPSQLSFLPDDYLEQKAQRRSNIVCAALAAIVLTTVGAAFSVTERMNRKVDSDNAITQLQYAEAARQITQVQSLQDKQRKMAHEAELSESLLEKVPRSYILAAITNSLPSGVSLLDFTLDAKRHIIVPPPVTAMEKHLAADAANKSDSTPMAEPIVYDVGIKLTGVADTDVQVSNFISHLGKSPLLRDVNLVVSDEYSMAEQKLRRFQLEMALDPNAEVNPGQPVTLK
jgi:Tfp pilus assembly protein PilN